MYCTFRDRNPTLFLKYRKILSLVSGNFRWAYLPVDYNSWPDWIVWTSCAGRKSSFGSILFSPVRWITPWTNIKNRTFARVSVVSEWSFAVVVYEKIFERIYRQPINLTQIKNNTAELYCILWRADKHWDYLGFSLKFTDFQQCTWLRPDFLFGKSVDTFIRAILRWKISNIGQLLLNVIEQYHFWIKCIGCLCLQIYFLTGDHCKTCETLSNVKCIWYPCRMCKHK